MAKATLAIGKTASKMDMVFSSGPMAAVTLVIGKTTREMAQVFKSRRMATDTLAIGKTTTSMAMVFTQMLKDLKLIKFGIIAFYSDLMYPNIMNYQ